ncbi:hypothetical protein U27_04134 [Candidatus Vecturithrix granuli]|uniref:Uncharacterized protein n=1 Tax=Vecturithrix granuli TaxID=1499967 RepID=A0A081BXW4_VECG1|nr:hypothetical protein U27_04134 [Candidatus Vecturithrix granuli]
MSARFEEYYGRKTGMKPDLDYIRREGLESILDTAPGKYVLLRRTDSPPDIWQNDCQHFSKMIDEAIYIGIQENDGSFHYEHWNEGKQLRLLSYNSDYSWHRVLGEPDEWEKHALFSNDILQRNLECFDNSHDEIKKAWERKHIREGDQFPAIHEIEAYCGVIDYIENSAQNSSDQIVGKVRTS